MATHDLLGINVARLDDTALHVPGTRVIDDAGNTRQYVKAGAAIALGDALILDAAEWTAATYDVTPAVAADTVIEGVAPFAVADNQFFWMYTAPCKSVPVKAAATVVAGAPAITTAVAGTLDDTAATAANALATAAGCGAIFTTVTTAGIANVRLI